MEGGVLGEDCGAAYVNCSEACFPEDPADEGLLFGGERDPRYAEPAAVVEGVVGGRGGGRWGVEFALWGAVGAATTAVELGDLT